MATVVSKGIENKANIPDRILEAGGFGMDWDQRVLHRQ